MSEDDLKYLEERLHSPAMCCRQCKITRALIAAARQVPRQHPMNENARVHTLVEGRSCGRANVDTGARCFLYEEEHGRMHLAWVHFPGQLVVWER